MSEAPPGRGLFASLRQLLGTVLEIAHVRLALLSTEIEQEKLRLFDAVLWAGLSLVLLGVGMLLLIGFVIVLFWDDHRLLALGILAALFLGSGGWLMRSARQRLRQPGGVFNTSVTELARDHAGLSARTKDDS